MLMLVTALQIYEIIFSTDEVTLKYPFFYRPSFVVLEDGWQAFKLESEWRRYKDCAEEWRITIVNKDYKVSVTP